MKILKTLLLGISFLCCFGTSIAVIASDIVVPSVTGLNIENAKEELENANLTIGELSRNSDGCNFAFKHVISQRPEAGKMVKRNSAVDLVVNDEESLLVPNVVGLTLAEADRIFAEAEITPIHSFTTPTSNRFPRYPCCEFDVLNTTTEDSISRTDPVAGHNLVCRGDQKVTTYRIKTFTYQCTYAVNSGELCP